MKVLELIDLLKGFDPEMPVCYRRFSEQCLLFAGDLKVENLLPARKDGWVPDNRDDKKAIPYLVFPGN